MSDQGQDGQEPPRFRVRRASRGARRLIAGLSPVWLVPLAALVVALAIALQAIAARGPMIEIAFDNADGIVAGETVLRFRDVEVGQVEEVSFSDDLARVVVGVRLDNDIAPYVDEEAIFWIVEPEVSARGVTGLDTVLTGVYIQGRWDREQGAAARSFEGRESPPINVANRPGVQITLRASSGGRLSGGSPIVYRGIDVGVIDEPQLAENGTDVTATAFIEAPHDRLVTTATRFWGASGFSVSFGASGFSLDVASLAALVEGGVAFSTVQSGGEPIEDGAVFDVFPDEAAARSAMLTADEAGDVNVSLFVDGSVDGLSVGAPVEFRGLNVGAVTELGVRVESPDGGDGAENVRLRVDTGLDAARLGLGDDADDTAVIDFLADAVEGGLRARLASANLLGTSLKVELVEIAEAEPAELDRDAEPYPVLPATEAALSDVTASAQTALQRITDLPVEGLLQEATDALGNLNRLLEQEPLQQTPAQVLGLVEDARGVVAAEEVRSLLRQADRAATQVAELTAALNDEQGLTAITEAARRSDDIAGAAQRTFDGLPALVGEVEALASALAELPLDSLISAATSFVGGADGFFGSQETSDLTQSITATLNELSTTLQQLNEGGAVPAVNQALASTSEAAEAIAGAAGGLPGLTDAIERLIGQSQSTLNAYDTRSEFNAQTLAAIRDLREAARAITSLSRAIERNPSSLILGR